MKYPLKLKEERFLHHMLGGHALSGLDSDFAEGNAKEFKEAYGMTFKQAEEALRKLRMWLNR